MSWKATAYVKELTHAPNGQKLTTAEKLLLFVLADYHRADGQGLCWPSLPRLAKESLLSRRHIVRVLKSLEDNGLISKGVSPKATSGETNNYRLNALDGAPEASAILSLPLDAASDMGVTSLVTPGARASDMEGAHIRKYGFNGKDKTPSEQSSEADASKEQEPTVDPRHYPLREKIKTRWADKAGCDTPPPWGPPEAAALSRLLKENPNWTLKGLLVCVDNRFASERNHAEQPRKWIRDLISYRNGALDRYGHPLRRSTSADSLADGVAIAEAQRATRRRV